MTVTIPAEWDEFVRAKQAPEIVSLRVVQTPESLLDIAVRRDLPRRLLAPPSPA